LYDWEIGSDALNYFLPFLRLAPVQGTSWSTLVTSGVPNVDYYLSSDLVERDDAQADYSERLVRLASLLSCQPRQTLPAPARDRTDLGLPAGKQLYVCPQNLIKLHPDFDDLAAGILRTDGDGVLVVKHGRWPRTGQRLLERFARSLPDVIDRVIILPWLSPDEYQHLLAAADVILDTPHYGAGSTTYDIFSVNQPLVTLPGRYNVGRYTLACYRRMGIADLIADSPQHYVQLAVRVATDRDFRQDVKTRIAERTDMLFDDEQAVAEHVRLFREALGG
jgi:predicted O-linked N-acetylglucosamine transferase (SPINDLY family)